MTFDYAFGGLAVSSTIALEGLRRGVIAGPALHVTGEVGPPPEPERVHFEWPGRYRLQLGERDGRWLVRSAFDGAFLIERDGSAMHIFAESLPPSRELLDVLTRRLLPRVTVLHGGTTIHGATLAGPDGALLMLGRSGAGKSTLTAALAHRAGWRIFSDDMSVLWDGAPAAVAPASTGVCLWPASREGLGLPIEECQPMPGYEGKLRYEPEAAPATASAPLRGVVFLNRSDAIAEPGITRVPLAEAMTGIIPQVMFFNPNGASTVERLESLGLVNRVMRAVPAWRLDFPASYQALPAVVETVTSLLKP